MAIWRGSSAVPSVGPAIHLKYKFLGGLDGAYLDQAKSGVALARTMIRTMNGLVQTGYKSLASNQRDVMDYYFVLKGIPPTAPEYATLQQVLQLTCTGLMGKDLSIKVTNKGDAMGYVNLHRGGRSKGRWTAGTSRGEAVKRGDIHLDSDRLDTGTEDSAKTIIHEATHKFASAADYGKSGYTNDEDGSFRADGLTREQALNNAESYARFVMMAYLYPN